MPCIRSLQTLHTTGQAAASADALPAWTISSGLGHHQQDPTCLLCRLWWLHTNSMALPAALQLRATHSTSMCLPWQQVLSETGARAEMISMAPLSPLQALGLTQSWLGARRESLCTALPAYVQDLAALDNVMVLSAAKRDQAALATSPAAAIGKSVLLAAQQPGTQSWDHREGTCMLQASKVPLQSAEVLLPAGAALSNANLAPD